MTVNNMLLSYSRLFHKNLGSTAQSLFQCKDSYRILCWGRGMGGGSGGRHV